MKKKCPWVEKYRPIHLNDILQQDNVTKVLYDNFITGSTMNYIFTGPPGTGKTSTILAFCKYLYGNNFTDYVLQINAFDEPNNLLSTIVHNFCKKSILPVVVPHPCKCEKEFNDKVDNQTDIIVNFKYIICDEADSLSYDTQYSFNRYMDNYNVRFCFLCNYQNNIIKTISSRCYTCYFNLLSKQFCLYQLNNICKCENVEMNEQTQETLEIIYNFYHGDLRKCIYTIQALYLLYGIINRESLYDYNRTIDPFVNLLIKKLYSTDFNLKDIDNEINNILNLGFTPLEIIRNVIEHYLKENITLEFANYLNTIEIRCTKNKIPHLLLFEFLLTFKKCYPKI